MSPLELVGRALLDHADLIEEVIRAVSSGVDKQKLLQSIRASMVEAHDAEVEAMLGPRQ